jgi:transmembrane sensor
MDNQTDDTFLARWLDGSLTATELQQLESSPEYPTLLRMKQNFAQLQSPRTADERILAHVIAHEKIAPVKVIPLYRKTWIAAAAMVVVLLGIGLYLLQHTAHSAPNGETYAFSLPDQSQVLLNAGSEASFKSWNWDNNRAVSLHGEAYFKVAKGQKFTVETDLGTVTVLGTQFNVKARDNRFEVTCYEGKVRVVSAATEQIILPGQRIIFNGAAKAIAATKAVVPEWTRHELLFENAAFAAVLAELERQYDVTIGSDLQTQQLFSGSVPGNDLDAALKIIAVTYHLDLKKSGNTVTLNPLQ